MLSYDSSAVYADDFTVGESLLDCIQSYFVLFWLVVGWHKHCPVDDKEVGMCRW